MASVTMSGLLDKVELMLQDNSPAMRAKLTAWANDAMQSLAMERPWSFLQKEVTLTVDTNTDPPSIALPTDFHSLINVRVEGGIFISGKYDYLSDYDAWVTFGIIPGGVSLPTGTTGTAVMKYICVPPEYTDTTTDTVFPSQCYPLLVKMTMGRYYEYDLDERIVPNNQLIEKEMRVLKKWDNNTTPAPLFNSRGYSVDQRGAYD